MAEETVVTSRQEEGGGTGYNTEEIISLLLPGMKKIARDNNGFVFYHAGKVYVVPETLVTELPKDRLKEFFNNDKYDKIKSLVIDAISKPV